MDVGRQARDGTTDRPSRIGGQLAALFLITIAAVPPATASDAARTSGGDRPAAIPKAAPGEPKPARIEDFAPPGEFVTVAAVKTHHLTRGAQGRPIVLIHGFGSSTYTWRRNIDDLARRYRVHALDLKGFGLTAKPRDGRYHIPAYTEHLLGYLDAMELRRPVLIGSSMGGAVAVHLALRHPGRVAGLVLVDAAPSGLPGRLPPTRQLAGGIEGEATRADVVPSLLRAMITRQAVGRWLKVSYHDPSLVTEEMIETYYRPITIEGATEALAAMTRPRAEAMTPLPPLSSLKCPTLLIWGAFDRIIPRAVADEYARTIPGSRLLVFERSGHLPHEEEPERFEREVARFVDRLP